MTSATLGARLRPAAGAAGRVVAAVGRRPGRALAAVVVLQVALAGLLFAGVAHNGWLTYQGGDQLWLVTSGWLLAHGVIAPAVVGPGLPVLLIPLSWLVGGYSLDQLPVTMLFQVLVAGPATTAAVYALATRVAGRIAGIWCALLVVVAPYVATPLFVDRYQERWTDQVLVQAMGLTQLADFPSTVLVVVAALFVVRSVTSANGLADALVAGAAAGLAITVKPANGIFLAGPVLAFVLARRWRDGAAMAAALLPALLTVALWKARGLASVPILALEEVHTAASVGVGALPVGNRYLQHGFDVHEWSRNMSNLREFFFSARVAQWIPFAGAFAVWRISRPTAGLLLGWVLAYFLVKGSSDVSSIENTSFWRLVMPALPAYVILAAAVPLLVPTLPQRLERVLAPPPPRLRIGLRAGIATALVVGLVPLVAVFVASPLRGADDAVVVNGILIPVDASIVSVTATKEGDAVRLRWTDETRTATTFYTVFRNESAGSDLACDRHGADRCTLAMGALGTTREHTWLDPDPIPRATYRVGVSANWLDDPAQGDVMVVSPPVLSP